MADGVRQMRAGTTALAMATEPTNREILLQMSTRDVMWPGEGRVTITPGGRHAIFVGSITERWLGAAPDRALTLDDEAGQAALSALIDGWAAGVVHTMAAAPRTKHELAAAGRLSAKATKNLLGRMRAVGLIEARPDVLFAPTDWLRAGIAPLLAAARLETRAPQVEMAPLTPPDFEATFQLALPLLRLPADASGSCAFAVAMGAAAPGGPIGVTARVENGRVVRCDPHLDESADARGVASAEDWLNTIIEPDTKSVRTSGDRLLASLLLTGLHKELFE